MKMMQIMREGEIRYRLKGKVKVEVCRALGRGEDDQLDNIFNVIQKRPNTSIHLKVEYSSRRSNGESYREVRRR